MSLVSLPPTTFIFHQWFKVWMCFMYWTTAYHFAQDDSRGSRYELFVYMRPYTQMCFYCISSVITQSRPLIFCKTRFCVYVTGLGDFTINRSENILVGVIFAAFWFVVVENNLVSFFFFNLPYILCHLFHGYENFKIFFGWIETLAAHENGTKN